MTNNCTYAFESTNLTSVRCPSSALEGWWKVVMVLCLTGPTFQSRIGYLFDEWRGLEKWQVATVYPTDQTSGLDHALGCG